jgi:hypothetical protein
MALAVALGVALAVAVTLAVAVAVVRPAVTLFRYSQTELGKFTQQMGKVA